MAISRHGSNAPDFAGPIPPRPQISSRADCALVFADAFFAGCSGVDAVSIASG